MQLHAQQARSNNALRSCDQRQAYLAERPERIVREQTSRLELLEAKLSAVDPGQALQRGYSITTTTSGQLVRRADQVQAGTELVTHLAVGTVMSTVTASDTTDQENHD